MPKVYLYRSGFSFLPAYSSDTDIMYRFKEGEVFSCEVKRERNYKFHKKFFALLQVGFQLQTSFLNFEWWRMWITMKAGYVESCEGPGGEWMFRPKSIAFDKLDQIGFEQVYKDVSNAIIRECKVDQQTLEENINLFL